MLDGEPHRLDASVERLLDGVPWVHTSGPYQALELRFGVRTCDPALGHYLDALLAPFLTSGSLDGVVWFSGLDRPALGEHRFVAYAGGRRVLATSLPNMLLSSLLWAFNRLVVGRATGCLLLHASAVERQGVVVVLPASQNSGKTTLCAGLLRRGYRYVTDEAVAVDIATGALRPFPKALSLDPGSWPLFSDLAPRLEPEQEAYVQRQWHVPAAQFGAQIADPVGSVARVLLSPRYAPGAQTTITPLRPAEAVVMLIENSFNPESWGQDGLDAAGRLVGGCSTMGRLSVGDLDEACAIVDRAVEQALASPRPRSQHLDRRDPPRAFARGAGRSSTDGAGRRLRRA